MPKEIVRYSRDVDTLVYQPVTDPMASGFRQEDPPPTAKTNYQVKSNSVGQQSNRTRPTKMLLKVPFGGDMYFSLDLKKIKIKTLNLSHI